MLQDAEVLVARASFYGVDIHTPEVENERIAEGLFQVGTPVLFNG